MRNVLRLLLFGLLLATAAAGADGVTPEQAHLAELLGIPAANLAPAPIPGLYRVTIGPQVAYISADGRYIIRGDIIDVDSGENMTASHRAALRLAYMQKLAPADMIVFSPPHPKHTITVLTDIDCEYCRVFESQRPALNSMGVAVRYMFYPDDGIGSASWHKAENVWCASDRKAALEKAMHGYPVKSPHCDAASMTVGYQFGRMMGVNGTPAIITDQGRLIPGYLPPAALLSLLNQEMAPVNKPDKSR